MRHGRRALVVYSAMLAVGLVPKPAATASLIDLEELGKAVESTAKAVGELGDSIAHMVSLGDQGWSTVEARRTRSRLVNISARLTQLSVGQSSFVETLNHYIGKFCSSSRCDPGPIPNGRPFRTEWEKSISKLQEITRLVAQLIVDLQAERSELVTQRVYRDLLKTLNGRVSVLDRLSGLSEPPKTPDQVAALNGLAANYETLIQNLNTVIDALDDYLNSRSRTR